MLFRDPSVWNRSNEYLLFEGAGTELVRSRLEKGQSAQAAALLDRMTSIAERDQKYDVFKTLADLYQKAGETEKAAGLGKKAADMAWVDLAGSFESEANTSDPENYLRSIQSNPANEIPGKTSALAVEYAANLRRASRLERRFSALSLQS